MPEALVLKEVSKRYGQGPFVIEGLSYTFLPGTATGLVGPNGSGKTTLLRLLTVISYPTSGQILFGDRNIHEEPYAYLRHVGIVPDNPEMPQYLSAVELLEYVLRARGRWDEAAQQRVAALLDRLMLDERRNNLIGTYSSGMMGKTQVALALAVQPAVLLLDEPFRALDEASTQATLGLLREFKQEGGILILSSHIRSTLEAVCDGYIHFRRRQPLPAPTL